MNAVANNQKFWIVAGTLVLLISGGVFAAYMIRGIQNNNPGNLRKNAYKGFLRVDKDGYAIFDTMENGIRAIRRQLQTNYSRGLDTIEETISSWAPANENDTPAYIAFVTAYLGDTPPNPYDGAALFKMCRAIIRMECSAVGALTISDATVQRGLELQ